MCHVGQRQLNSECHTEVVDRVSCENGTMYAPGMCSIKNTKGEVTWRYRPNDDDVTDMYQVCHNEFFASLRAGKTINTGEYMAKSTAHAILGREATHTGKRVTWKSLFKSDEDMAPDSLKFEDDFAIAPVPEPGKKA